MSIESMKQALEALEDLYAEQNAAPLWKRREHWENAMIKADVAIPNLRSAIEQIERAEPVANLTIKEGRVAVAAKILPDGIYDLYSAPFAAGESK